MKCIICQSNCNKIFNFNSDYEFFKCENCDFTFRNPADEKIDYYADYVDKSLINKSVKLAQNYYKRFSKYISNNSKVLEVGGSLGYFGKELIDRKQCQVYNFELSEFGREYSQELGNKPIVSYDELENEKFDTIVSFHVIEHVKLEDIEPFITKLMTYLNPNGHLIIVTPNANSNKFTLLKAGYPWIAFPEHIGFLSKKSVNTIAKRNNLNLVKVNDEIPAFKHYPSYSFLIKLRRKLLPAKVEINEVSVEDSPQPISLKSRIIGTLKSAFNTFSQIEKYIYLPLFIFIDFIKSEKDELVIIIKKE